MVGGFIYISMELIFRGRSHWTMFLLGGLCFVCLGLINELIPWQMPLLKQMFIGMLIITYFEFITGCVVNIWLGWGIWDYSNIPGNILGQICPVFSFLWFWISGAGIILDDWLRYWLFGEDRPHYTII
ncbi:MAG: putative ABC transporter permease [Hungatella sp.]|nr:putative ABC transporter permease [Hungatella sp.]